MRKREAKIRALKIRDNIRKEYVDKKAGRSYASGCNDPSQKEVKNVKNCKTGVEKPVCPQCGKIGHKTSRSRNCTFTTYQPHIKEGKFCLENVAVTMYPNLAHTINRY